MIDAGILLPEEQKDSGTQIATIMAVTENGVRIRLDDEETVGQKEYKYLSGYLPAVGDRVYFARVSGTYLILGKVG